MNLPMKGFIVAAAVGLIASGAAAATLTSEATSTYVIDGRPIDQDGPNSTVNGTATSSVDTPDAINTDVPLGTIDATQNADGTSFVEASAGSLFDGTPAYVGTAIAKLTQEVTNTSGADETYTMDYLLAGMSIYLNGDNGGATNNGNPFPSLTGESVGGLLDYTVTANGIPVFNAHIEAFGGAESYESANATNLTGSFTPFPAQFGGFNGTLFNVDPVSGTLTFAPVADGDTLTVEAVLTAQFYANAFENEVGVFFSDPQNITKTGALTLSGGPQVVPLPAAGWLLLSGLGGLALFGRRRF